MAEKRSILVQTCLTLVIVHSISLRSPMGKLWISAILLVIVAAHRDDTALLQSSVSRQLKDIGSESTSTWSSPRDVAILRDPQQVRSAEKQNIELVMECCV